MKIEVTISYNDILAFNKIVPQSQQGTIIEFFKNTFTKKFDKQKIKFNIECGMTGVHITLEGNVEDAINGIEDILELDLATAIDNYVKAIMAFHDATTTGMKEAEKIYKEKKG